MALTISRFVKPREEFGWNKAVAKQNGDAGDDDDVNDVLNQGSEEEGIITITGLEEDVNAARDAILKIVGDYVRTTTDNLFRSLKFLAS